MLVSGANTFKADKPGFKLAFELETDSQNFLLMLYAFKFIIHKAEN